MQTGVWCEFYSSGFFGYGEKGDFQYFLPAFVILLAEMSYFWRVMYVGIANTEEHNLMDKLPLQVCLFILL